MLLLVYLFAALALGALPARTFYGRGMMYVDGAQMRARFMMANPGDNRRRRRWWKSLSIWVEPLRGLLIGWLLCRGVRAEAYELDRSLYVLAKHGALACALVITLWQTCGREKENETLAPVLLICGLLVGGFGGVMGISAMAVGLLALFATQSVGGTLWAMAATTAAAGWFLIGPGVTWLVAVSICLIPWARSFLLRQRVVLALRG